MNFRTASPEFKNTVELLCPNEFNLRTRDWLKIAAKTLNFDHSRLVRLWRDNRSKLKQTEIETLEHLMLERTLRRQHQLEQQLAYQRNLTTGRLNEIYQEHCTADCGPAPGRAGRSSS